MVLTLSTPLGQELRTGPFQKDDDNAKKVLLASLQKKIDLVKSYPSKSCDNLRQIVIDQEVKIEMLRQNLECANEVILKQAKMLEEFQQLKQDVQDLKNGATVKQAVNQVLEEQALVPGSKFSDVLKKGIEEETKNAIVRFSEEGDDEGFVMVQSKKQVTKEVNEALGNQRKAEERKLNLLICNVPESKKPDQRMTSEEYAKWRDDCRQKDSDVFLEAAKTCETAIIPDDIAECRRLGHFDEAKPHHRAVLIKLKDEGKKKALFQKLHLFRQAQIALHGQGNEGKIMNIRHDFTTEQKAERTQKLSEIAGKNEALPPNSNVKHVLRGPPWDQQIRQIRVDQAAGPILALK